MKHLLYLIMKINNSKDLKINDDTRKIALFFKSMKTLGNFQPQTTTSKWF